jgi:hypothetical protein
MAKKESGGIPKNPNDGYAQMGPVSTGKATDDHSVMPSMPSATGWEDQWSADAGHGGGNISGHEPVVDLFMVHDFQGMSGQGNNQSVDRPKGSS